MSFFSKQLFCLFTISVLFALIGCHSVEEEDDYIIEDVSDAAPEVEYMDTENIIDALDVEISTLVGTWKINCTLLGPIKPPKVETFGYTLKIYSFRDNYYVDYSFTIKERISLDGEKNSRQNITKTSNILYKKIPFKKENLFFLFTIPDSNKNIYFIANINEGRIVLEESDSPIFFSPGPFKTYYVKEEN